jgi:hypothetical protein
MHVKIHIETERIFSISCFLYLDVWTDHCNIQMHLKPEIATFLESRWFSILVRNLSPGFPYMTLRWMFAGRRLEILPEVFSLQASTCSSLPCLQKMRVANGTHDLSFHSSLFSNVLVNLLKCHLLIVRIIIAFG